MKRSTKSTLRSIWELVQIVGGIIFLVLCLAWGIAMALHGSRPLPVVHRAIGVRMCTPECAEHGPMQFRAKGMKFVCNGFDGEGCADPTTGKETAIPMECHLAEKHPDIVRIATESGAHAQALAVEVEMFVRTGDPAYDHAVRWRSGDTWYNPCKDS